MGGGGSKENESKSNMCMTCKVEGVEKEAEAVCVDCAEPLCSNCVRDHRKNKASRNHNIQEGKNADDFRAFRSIKSMVSCQKHPEEEVSIECVDHVKFMCRKCHFASHIACHVKELGNVAISDEVVKKTSDILNEVQIATTSARTTREENIKTLLDKQTKLKQERDMVLRKFEKLNEELEKEISALVSEERDHLEKDIDGYKGTEEELKMNETFIEKVVESGNAVWIEVVNDFVTKKANELKDKTKALSSKKVKYLNFKPSKTFMTLKYNSSLGCIEMINEDEKISPGQVSPVISDSRMNLEFSSDAIEESYGSTSSNKDAQEVPGNKY